eukprot:scaffold93325_cov60-Phaeocystis_antarctica.AAC.3
MPSPFRHSRLTMHASANSTSPTANFPLGHLPDLSHGHESGRSQTRISRSPGGVAKCIFVLPCPGSCAGDRGGDAVASAIGARDAGRSMPVE